MRWKRAFLKVVHIIGTQNICIFRIAGVELLQQHNTGNTPKIWPLNRVFPKEAQGKWRGEVKVLESTYKVPKWQCYWLSTVTKERELALASYLSVEERYFTETMTWIALQMTRNRNTVMFSSMLFITNKTPVLGNAGSVEIYWNLLILSQNRATEVNWWLDFDWESVDFSRFPLIQV